MTQQWDAAEFVRKDFLERDENLEGGARMFYAGETPWHGLGRGVAEAQTSKEAIVLAGLDNWDVKLGTLFGPDFTNADGETTRVIVEDKKAIVRGMDGKVLGIATDSFQPVQNEDAFGFMDSLIQDRLMRYVTAGSLLGGRKVWMLAELDQDIRIGDDDYKPYLLLVMGNDALTAIKVYVTLVRVVCNNTLMQATRNVKALVSVNHIGDMAAKFDNARKLLNVTTESQRRMVEWLQKQSEKKVTDHTVTVVREKLFGSLDEETPTRRRTAIERFMAMYQAEQEREGRTGYALVQAVTGYGDHGVGVRERADGDERMISALGGAGAAFKDKGLSIIAAQTKIALPAGYGYRE